MIKMWVEVWGRYSMKETTKVLARMDGGYAIISKRQEREALRRIHAISGDRLECYSRPYGWTGAFPTVWVNK